MERYRSQKTKEPIGFVYFMSNKKRNVIYIGVTRNLRKRVKEHKERINSQSFAARYNCIDLIYYEYYDFLSAAIAREKQLKNWNRKWKDELIEQQNPKLRDLYEDLQTGKLGSDDLYF
jgi:putative endonuclease